ncbi:MFS transporter [Cellulomonas iranensis]|uniref:MFS transporter n=1 Tax=Cellulomonas iranensis TaxID=76862 RepID=UPI000B3CC025|nr:MFS transporter [Cellulomonas iranensis]
MTASAPTTDVADRSIWTRGFVYVFAINLVINLAQFMMNTLVPKLAVELGASAVVVGVVAGMFAVTALSVRPVVGPATVRLRRNHLLAGTSAVIMLAFVVYSVADSVPVMMAGRLLHGAGMGFLAPVMLALASDNLPERRMASGIGIFSLGQAVATAIGPSVGLALQPLVGYRWTFLAGAVVLALASLLALRVPSDPPAPPSGRLFSWRAFVASEAAVPAVVLFFLAGAYAGVTSFVVLYGEALGVRDIGLFFTAYALCVLVSRPVAGRIADRFGLTTVILPGMAVFAASFVLLAHARTLGAFLVAGAVSAFGYGVCQPAIQTMSLMSVDKARRGVAGNTSYIGVDLGYLVMPVVAGAVVSAAGRHGADVAQSYSTMFLTLVVPVVLGMVVFLVRGRRRATRVHEVSTDA